MNSYVKTTCLFIIIFAMVMCSLSAAIDEDAPKEEDDNSLVFFIPQKNSPIKAQIADLWTTIGEKLGVRVDVMSVADCDIENPTNEQILEWAKKLILAGVIDITIAPPTGMFRLEEEGAEFFPIATYTLDKKRYDRSCIYVKKDSPYFEIETPAARLEALKGAKVGIAHGIKANPVGEMLLISNGVPSRSDDFFQYYDGFGGTEKNIARTLDGTIEGFITLKVDLKFHQEKEKLMEIAPLVCGDRYVNMPMIIRKGIDRDTIIRLRKLILNIHKDQDFPQLKFLFYLINGHFVPVGRDDYDNWKTIYEKGRAEGWINDIGEVEYKTLADDTQELKEPAKDSPGPPGEK